VAALLEAHPHSKAQELPQTHTRTHTSLPANNCYRNTYLLLLPAHPATSNGMVCCGVTPTTWRRDILFLVTMHKAKKRFPPL